MPRSLPVITEKGARGMNLRRLPFLRGEKTCFPSKPVCPACGRNRVFEPHSFAVVAAGALMKMRGGAAGPDPRMEGFLGVTWHGAHDGGSFISGRRHGYGHDPGGR